MVKQIAGAIILALGLFSGAAHAGKTGSKANFLVIEIMDLSCERCASFAPFADQVASEVRADGGVFRVAPAGPLVGVEPSQTVSAVYAVEVNQGDADAQHITDALIRGYEGGAELGTLGGILSWLQMQAPDFRRTELFNHDDALGKDHLYRAMRLAKKAGVSELPAIIVLSKSNGEILGVATWKGDAPSTLNSVEDLLKKLSE